MSTLKEHVKNRLCVIPLCKNERFDLVHKFPMDNQRAEMWRQAIIDNLPDINNLPLDLLKKRTICSKHFRKEDYKNVESRSLNKTAIPSLNFKSSVGAGNVVVDSVVSAGNVKSQKCKIQGLTDEEDNRQMECRVSMNNHSDPVIQPITVTQPISSNNRLPVKVLVKTRKEQINLRKYHRKSDATAALINLEGSPPKYRLVQFTQVEVTESLPVAESLHDNYVSLVPVINYCSPSIPGSVNLLGQSSEQLDFVAAKTSVNFQDVQNLNEIVQTIPCYVTMFEDSIIINLPDFPEPLKLNNFWLRDHCSCSECYNHETKQRKICFLDIPIDIKPSHYNIDGKELQITWSDNHRSSYDLVNLSLNTFEKHKTFVQTKDQKILWNAESIKSLAYARVSFPDYLCDAEVAKKFVSSLVTYGVAFIEKVPPNMLTTEVAIKRLFSIQKTFFGDMWSFNDNKVHNDNAYTREYLAAHTDNMYFNDAAGIQALHCLSHTGKGGETLLVDGFNVLNNLKMNDVAAYKRLCTTNVESEYIDDGRHHTYMAPIVKLHPLTKEPEQIRFNSYDRSPMRSIPMEEMSTFYKDMRHLVNNIQSPKNEWWFKLEPGTIVFFDNWRVLHGRSSYTGNRQMAGAYVSRTEFLSVARTMNLIS